MTIEQRFKDAAREWHERAAPWDWTEAGVASLAAEMQRQAALCVREYHEFEFGNGAVDEWEWAFEEQEGDDDAR